MKLKVAVVALLLLLVLTSSSACVVVVTNTGPGYYGTGVPTYYGTTAPTYYGTVQPQAVLSIVRNELAHDKDGTALGLVSIKNVSDHTCEFASVTGQFFDVNNNLIYTSTDTILNLGSGETWDYTFTCSGTNCNKVATFKVDVTYG
jgi:hypothetical protein